MKKYTMGIDFGTLSARAVIIDAVSGEILASSVCEYKHGVIDKELPCGKKLSQRTALQDGEDYRFALSSTVRAVISDSGVCPEDICGIGIDFTGCTLIPVDKMMRPLSSLPEYSHEPHAYVKLWKHNSATTQRERIDRLARERGEKWLSVYSGRTSAEWTFAKILQIIEEAPEVYDNTYMYLNSADWIVYLLTGEITNSANFAGYKELWNAEDGFPSPEFFEALCPKMKDIIGTKVCDKIATLSAPAGYVSEEGSRLTGLPVGIPVATPVIDAHASMPALSVVDSGVMMTILGTSGSYMTHSSEKIEMSGIMGYVKDGIVDGLYSYEAAQATCGDHLDWYIKNALPEAYTSAAEREGVSPHKYLREKAKHLRVGESGLLYLDWQNGNRCILSDLDLTGALFGLTLQTRPEEIYRAMIEGVAFGAKMIIDNFSENGIEINRLVASGGIAEKDEMFMQIYADTLDKEITVSSVRYSAAKGSAIYGAVAAGIYNSIREAAAHLGSMEGKIYRPDPHNAAEYRKLYAEYVKLHDYFGRGGNDVLRRHRAE